MGRTDGHQRGENMAPGGENRWPYLGRNRWPLTEEIADRLGLARSTVNKYRRDPEGERERARRERYRGRCRGCGRPTRGSDGPGRAPEWCPESCPFQASPAPER